MNEIYRDVRGSSLSSPELDRIKTEFEADIRRQLSFKVSNLIKYPVEYIEVS